LQAAFFAEVAEETELPPGVFNVVNDGPDLGAVISSHPAIDAISFTGSTAVGRQIMANAAGTLKRLVLQLGGKSANIVFADALEADAARVLRQAVAMFTLMAGQACAATTRILVEEPVYGEFVERLGAALSNLTIGDPFAPGTNMGPLIRAAARERVESYVATGVKEGGDVVCGGRRPPTLDKGFFYEPTLFIGLATTSRPAREEIFGPVAVVIPFKDAEDAVRIANDSPYGLSSAVHSSDMRKAWNVARQLRTGRVEINGGGAVVAPFGGVKQSGFGRELGAWAFDHFTADKSVVWPL
jgi:acyl-CoA reductase-like NAD-dependent aldehyde dehydrogenase